MSHRPYLYLARQIPKGAPAYLPGGYKDRAHRAVTGRAASGEVSPQGLVAHTEDWEGRVAADVAPSTMRYILNRRTGEIRKMTVAEQVERGYFTPGVGPKGVKL